MTEPLPTAATSSRPPPPRDAPAATLRVMSFNVRYGDADDGSNGWEFRHDLLVRTIRTYDPDLLGVQEALDDQFRTLCDALGADYGCHGVGRDDGRSRGEHMAIYFRRGRFERQTGGHFWLSETPDRPGSKSWDAEVTRMASWVKLFDRASGGELLFVNTHWDHIGKRARLESARLIRRRVREILPGGTVIIIGDFNAREDDEEYTELLRATDDDGPRYLDAYRQIHPQRQTDEATFHAFKGGKEGSRIDWIVHSEDLKATDATIDRTSEDGRYPSDHYAVTAVLVRAAIPGA